MYSIVGVNGEENKKANGVNKNVVKNTRHKTFVNFFFNKNKMKRIKNKLHRIVTFVKWIFLVLMIKKKQKVMALIVWIMVIKI